MRTRSFSFFRYTIVLNAVVLAAGVSSARAQTAIVDFRNNQTDFPTQADRDVYDVDFVTPLVGTNFQARLLYGADAAGLQPATYATPARFRNVTTGAAIAGTWVGGYRTLVGFLPGQTITLQIQVWDAGPGIGRSVEETVAMGGWHFCSAPFPYTIPDPGSPPAVPTIFYMDNLRSFGPHLECIPEPSVFALGALGLVALSFLKRRSP